MSRPVSRGIRRLQPHGLDLRRTGHASVAHNAAHMFNALFESVHRLLKIYQSQLGFTGGLLFSSSWQIPQVEKQIQVSLDLIFRGFFPVRSTEKAKAQVCAIFFQFDFF